MSRVYFIRDARGERRVNEAELPLQVGGAERADVVVPGVAADAIVAVIALSGGHAYIAPAQSAQPKQAAQPAEPAQSSQPAQPTQPAQPVGRAQPAADPTALYHNHARISESTWLKSGDHVQVADGMMTWTVKGDQAFIDVTPYETSTQIVPPPAAPPPPPPRRDGAPVSAPPPKLGRPALRRSLLAAFGLMVLAAIFVVVAVPVTIDVSPAPDSKSLRGFPAPLLVWGNYLALPGVYTVRASKTGYRRLEEKVEVAMWQRVELHLQLRELPGRVTISVEPVVAYRLFVDDEPAGAAPDGSWEIGRGARRLRLETDRYLPEQADVQVAGLGAPQTVSFQLRAAWADVRLESRPAGAEVAVQGEIRGVTPLDLQILQGQPTIVLSLAGHKSVTLSPEIRAGEALSLTDITLDPADARLSVTSDPAEAIVRVDGDFHGTTPTTVTMASNVAHRIEVSKAGFQTNESQLTLAPDEESELAVSLAPSYGVIFLTTQPADATLTIDGKAAGKATQRLRLTTRAHTLELRKSGYAPRTVTVIPEQGVSKNVDVVLMTIAEAAEAATPDTIKTAGGQVLRLLRPGGPFAMGASRRDAGRRANESARTVELTRPFYLAETEVSNAQFRRFDASHRAGTVDGARLDGDDRPVVNVDWDAAARYCNWLSRQDGLPAAYRGAGGKMVAVVPATTGYRLPTEAEWAYAARIHGRDQPASYSWNGDFPPTTPVGNFADARIADTLADVVPGYDDGYRGTAPVGSYPADAAGLYDMAGNVAEWTNDFYAVHPGEEQRVVRDPTGPAVGQHHVVRGSSWRHGSITELRASYRDYGRTARSDLGFRIARYAASEGVGK